jgi:hypothetical protein
MVDSRLQPNVRRSQGSNSTRQRWVLRFVIATLVFSPVARAQSAASSPAAPVACPVQFVRFNPSGVSVRIKNVSGKKIVGLVFNAALADATENWKWYHWSFDDTRPIREFGWNRLIKDGASKTLTWYREDLDFEHGGGGAFVLTSALFEDGSVWEESGDSASCKYIWYNNHKKSFVRPVLLPLRQ